MAVADNTREDPTLEIQPKSILDPEFASIRAMVRTRVKAYPISDWGAARDAIMRDLNSLIGESDQTDAAAPRQAQSNRQDEDGFTTYGCIKARNNFKEIKFEDREFDLDDTSQAQRILKYLCKNGAVGPGGQYVEREELEDSVLGPAKTKADKDKRKNWRVDNQFTGSPAARALWPCIENPSRITRYRIKGPKTDTSG